MELLLPLSRENLDDEIFRLFITFPPAGWDTQRRTVSSSSAMAVAHSQVPDLRCLALGTSGTDDALGPPIPRPLGSG